MRKSNVYNAISKNHTKELWSYHEGTFYPNTVVGRFLTFLSDKFDDEYLIAHDAHCPLSLFEPYCAPVQKKWCS